MEKTVGFLIEADKRGLESTLKSGLENIRSFIKQSEGTPLRWDKIFAAKVPQAVIGVIAASFAAGIANALKAQEEMAKGGADVGKTMEEMNEMFSSAAKSISSTGVSSFEDVTAAISSAYKVPETVASPFTQICSLFTDPSNVALPALSIEATLVPCES